MSRSGAWSISLWAFFCFTAQVPAQSVQEAAEPAYKIPNGLHFVGGSVSAGYSSSLGSLGSTWNPSLNGPLFYEWASLLLGYMHTGPNHAFVVNYTPSYSGTNGIGSLYSFDQRLSIGYSRRYSPKVMFHFAGDAADVTLQDFLFSANLAGGLTDSTAPGAVSPATTTSNPETLLYGTREFTFSARTGFEYKATNRLSVSVEGGIDQAQAMLDNNDTLPLLIPRARSEHGNIGLSYEITTRTELQTTAAVTDEQSPFANYLITTVTEGILRRLTRHWFVSVQAGGGIYKTDFPNGPSPVFSSYVAGGGFGYKGRANTFGATFNRAIGDSFGVGSGSTYSFQGSWNWHRPGSGWGFHAGGMQQQLIGGHLGNVSLWQAGAGVTHALSGKTYLGVEYAYLLDTAIPLGFAGKPQAHAVRLTFGWNALGHHRPRLSVPVAGAPPAD